MSLLWRTFPVLGCWWSWKQTSPVRSDSAFSSTKVKSSSLLLLQKNTADVCCTQIVLEESRGQMQHQHCCFSNTACFQEEHLLLAIKVCRRIWMTAVHVHRQVKHREHWHCSSDTRFRHSLDVSSSPAVNYHLATAGNCTASLFLPTPCWRPI